MAKANVVLADGTKVTIDGTPQEVASLLLLMAGGRGAGPVPPAEVTPARRSATRATKKSGSAKFRPKGPADYVRELIEEDFFETRRGLTEVQKKLEEGAHIYPVTSLSPTMFRLVGQKELRRIKDGKAWKYVNP